MHGDLFLALETVRQWSESVHCAAVMCTAIPLGKRVDIVGELTQLGAYVEARGRNLLF